MSRHLCLALFALASLLSPSIRADDTEKPIAITAEQLWKAFDDNGVKAAMDYKGRVVEVSGRIDGTGKIVNSSSVTMGDGKETFTYCHFVKSEEDNAAKLQKRQDLTVIGECGGRSVLGHVSIFKCHIKKAGERIIEVTWDQLGVAYDDNEIKADMDYKDRILVVSNCWIASIRRVGDKIHIGVGGDTRFVFDKSEEKEVAKLKVRQKAVIVGRCDGRVRDYIVLSKCRIQTD